MEMKKEELDEILENHVKWLNEDGGKRADLSGADLRGADLSDADLSGANLPTGIYQIVGVGSYYRCTTYDSINDRVICGCWNDNAGNHLDSFARRIEQIYGAEGEEPNLKYYTEYMSMVNFFKAMKELRERYLKEGKDDGQNT